MEALDKYKPIPEFANTTFDWLVALAIAAAWFLALLALRRLIRRYHERRTARPQTDVIEVVAATLGRTSILFILVLSAEAALATLTPSSMVARITRSAVMICLIWQVGLWTTAATSAVLERRRLSALETDRAVAGSLDVIEIIVRIAIWSIVMLLILANAGVDVSALLAGLGIGGVAVALALQNVLGDLFASLSITFDRPFVVGDRLIVADYSGVVEHIGLKSTRLRAPSGEQIIVSNADLLRSRLRNYGPMSERRVEFNLGVAYATPADKLEAIPDIIRGIVMAQPDTRFERSHLARHGDFSLDFVTVYHVLSPDLARHMDIQHAIQVRIHREFAEAGIEFSPSGGPLALCMSAGKVDERPIDTPRTQTEGA